LIAASVSSAFSSVFSFSASRPRRAATAPFAGVVQRLERLDRRFRRDEDGRLGSGHEGGDLRRLRHILCGGWLRDSDAHCKCQGADRVETG
jgi:hypothetical protein